MNTELSEHDRRQAMFNTVAAHLLKQNARSVKPHPSVIDESVNGCAYRGDNGLKCAIGALIPDDKYLPNLEGLSAQSVEVCVAANIDLEDAGFATTLQAIHDFNDAENWHAELKLFAKMHGLNYDVLS